MSTLTELINEVAKFKHENEIAQKRLEAYQAAINKIDDWFEYMNESQADREKIHEILDNLTLKLATIK